MKIMNSLVKTLAKASLYYDNLKEPKRFMTAMIIISPWFIFGILGMMLASNILVSIGFLHMLIVLNLRMWWLIGNLKKYLR